MTKPIDKGPLKDAYDKAAAVISKPFRFAEWSFIHFGDIPIPFQLPGSDASHHAAGPIDREKWIYVFRHEAGSDLIKLQEEIWINAKKDQKEPPSMGATPHEDHDDLETAVKNRTSPVPFGTTMCLPRRIFGKPQLYRFFASRVRLPLEQIKDLEKKVHKFVPATDLELGGNLDSSVFERDGILVVPVVDPITVMLHLHAAYVAADYDLISYTTNARRTKKHILATLLKGIIGDEKNRDANNLVHELIDEQYPLEQFLKDYDNQCQWLLRERDFLAHALVNWLKSDAITIVDASYKALPRATWGASFLVPWCHAILQLSHSPEGRKYLATLPGDKTHFIRTYVWPREKLGKDELKVVRKGGLDIVAAWAEIATAVILPQMVEGKTTPLKGGQPIKDIEGPLGNLLDIKVPETTVPIPLKVKTGAGYVKTVDSTVINVAQITDDIRNIKAGEVEAESTVEHFTKRPESIEHILTAVNLVLSINELMEKLEGDDPKERQLAMLECGSAVSDMVKTILLTKIEREGEEVVKGAELFKGATVLGNMAGLVAGVIDVYIGTQKMDKAFAAGNQPRANAEFLTTAGAGFGVSSTLMALMAVPGGFAVAALGIAIGIIATVWKLGQPTPMQLFFNKCSWGQRNREEEGDEWSPTKFKEWTGPKEFDNQLEALLQLIVKPEMSFVGGDIRALKIEVGFLPTNSKVEVFYHEKWEGRSALLLHDIVVIKDQKASTKEGNFDVKLENEEGKSAVHVRPLPKFLKEHPVAKPEKKQMPGVPGILVDQVPDLEEAFVAVHVHITLDGKHYVKIPFKKEKDEPFKQMLVKDGYVKTE